MWNPLRRWLYATGRALARLGLVDRERAERSSDLAWPQMLTGLARQSRRTADLAMVGISVGPAAVAGLGFALTFWLLVGGLSVGVAGGTVSLVSQRYGAERFGEIDLVVKGSLAITLVLSLPLTLAYWAFAADLIGLLGADARTIRLGGRYLQLLSLGIVFKFGGIVGGRVLVGADDAWTPMVLRVAGATSNVLLNAILVFGLGMGVTGAALGTALATAAVAVAMAVGLVRGGLPLLGAFPVTVGLGGPHLDRDLLRDHVEIAAPLVVRRVGGGLARFPFIALVAGFGTVFVAAYTVSRRLRGMIKATNDGFGLAASSLVGQHLGTGDEREAEAYGWDIFRFSVLLHVATGAVVAVFARPIAELFVQSPAAVEATVPFVWVVTLAAVGIGIDGAATGTLRAGGDTRWPMYGRLLGRYSTIPLAYLGTITPLGIVAVYVALLAETFLPAGVTFYRFRTGAWKAVSRAYRPDAE